MHVPHPFLIKFRQILWNVENAAISIRISSPVVVAVAVEGSLTLPGEQCGRRTPDSRHHGEAAWRNDLLDRRLWHLGMRGSRPNFR